MESSSSTTTQPEMNIVLLGKTGVGKSASGNSIVGESVFLSEQGSSSVTAVCQKHSSTVAGRTLTVVDTPGFFTTQLEDVSSEMKKSVDLVSPGVDVFAYVVPLAPFTKQEADAVRWFVRCFGEAAAGYTVVLFTYGDQRDSRPVEAVIEQNTSLAVFIEACGGRYCVFNNKLPPGSSEANDQVMRLLQVVDGLMRGNGGSCYTARMLEEHQEQIREEVRRKEEEKQRQHQENIQQARQETKERVRREENERIERERQAEKEFLDREIKEEEKRKKERKQTERMASNDIPPPEPVPKTQVSPPMTSEGGENLMNQEKAYEEEEDGHRSTAATLATRGAEGFIQSNAERTENDYLLNPNNSNDWKVFIREPWVLCIAVVICVGIGAGIGVVVTVLPDIGFSTEIVAWFGAGTGALFAVIAWAVSIGLIVHCRQR